jgi:dipeptidyl aminopeptidase/acylaminoacyl peptidase
MTIRMSAGALLAMLPLAAGAEVKLATADAMLIRHEFRIEAPAAKAWDALVHPERYWPSDHTWSGQRESLSLDPVAGGCYCERWDGGSAEHGRVVMAVPGKKLAIDAALGPFLEMAISGILAVSLEEKDGITTAVVTYRVSGDPAHRLDGLAPIVDQVLGMQFGAFAKAAAAAVPAYGAAAFYQTVDYSIANPQWAYSPDGRRLLVTANPAGVFNAHALDLATGEQTALTSSTTNAIFAVSWFPDGKRFLYTFDEGGNELNHVYVGGAEGGPRDLTPGEKVKASFVGWVEGGKAFIVASNERDPKFFDLYRYRAQDYARELVFRNELGLNAFVASRDGRHAAGIKPRTSADDDIWLVPLTGKGEPRLVTAHQGNASHAVYEFTPEGDALVYGTDQHGEFTQAWTYALAGGGKKPLIAADWDVMYVSFSPSGRYRVHGINEDAATAVTIHDRRTGADLRLPAGLPKGDLRQVRFSPDEKQIAFLINADNSPSNVFTVELATGAFRQWTQALNPAIDPGHLVTSTVVRYQSYDGLEIPSILYRPHGASAKRRTPALVWVHGGPGGQSRTGYSAIIQHLVNHGYAVLAANNRGSSGYGKTFYHLDDKRHGDVDLKDIVAGRAYLESLDWVDGKRIGIIGGSYGGYMVMAALAFEPQAFDVGINIFGVTNWVRTLTSIPPWWEAFKEALYDEMGDPATDQERHRRISPLFHAKNVVKPVLVIQGANDPRVLQVESDEMVAAVKANDVPVEYVLFPDEGHGFAKRENRIAASEAFVKFLDQYLRKPE